MLEIAVWCLIVTALMAYLNHRFIGLPTTIGVMAIALVMSVALIGLDHLGWSTPHRMETKLMASIDFPGVLMRGMLAVLLFAGGLHVDLERLRRHWGPIMMLTLFGTLASAALVGWAMWKLMPLAHLNLALPYCLIFGALISPTDAVAVTSILQRARVPATLESIIAGESLFNDAVGVVLFSLALDMLMGDRPTVTDGLMQLVRESVGGVSLGLTLGYGLCFLLKDVRSYQVEVLLTLATVMGGYGLADRADVSGPLAMVVVGLVVGTQSRTARLPEHTREHLDRFWVLVDGLLNTMLFVLIGLEVVRVSFSRGLILAVMLTIIITLVARSVSVGALLGILRLRMSLPRGSWQLVSWAGLRGGVSVALALSLPPSRNRDIVLALTYGVVVFSVLAQGLTIGRLARRVIGQSPQ